MNIFIIALNTFKNPRIERSGDGAFFKLNLIMYEGDVIEISTTRGQKYVRLNGRNVINHLADGSTWLQMDVGENELTLIDDDNSQNAYMEIKYKRAFV